MQEKIMISEYAACRLCPRACGVNRYEETGFCGAGSVPRAARAALHKWEEPCLVGNTGAGAIFFSNCNLKCVFCQNHDISSGGFGADISTERIGEMMLELQEQGAACIEFITATHYIPSVAGAVRKVRDRLKIPTVFNCGGYESPEALKQLEGCMDIYLPDIKYFDDAAAVRYSAAPRYFMHAVRGLKEMLRQTGRPERDENGMLKKGVLVRHMVMPGMRKDSLRILDELAASVGTESILISLMSQYTPFFRAEEFPEINRRITSLEYDSVVRYALGLGFDGYMQEKSSAKEEYTPPFDLSGVKVVNSCQ